MGSLGWVMDSLGLEMNFALAQPFVKEVSNVISCRSNVLHSPTRRDATQPYVLVYPNQLLRLLDLDPIRLKFPQEIMPCGKTHNPNHNYHRLQVPPKPWLRSSIIIIKADFYIETHLLLLFDEFLECLCWPSPSAPVR